MSSCGRAIVGESGLAAAVGRSSSDTADVIGGFIGVTFSPIARVTIETGERTFASVAFPVSPTSTRVSSVLDELGEPNTARWRLGHWSPGDSTYVEAADGELDAVERGQGYWLITASRATVVEDGLTAPVAECEIDLEDGPGGRPAYNQLGNPFLFPILLADLQVTDGATTVPLLDLRNTLTETAAKVYDTDMGHYVSNPPMIAGRAAFWVKKLTPGRVSLIVPYEVGHAGDEAPAPAKPTGARWAVSVRVRQGSRSCEPLVVGAAQVPAGRWNPLCVSLTPDPPGGGLGLSVRQDGWGRSNGDYVRVFRPAEPTMSWDIDVRGAESPGELVLDIDTFDLPAGARVRLDNPYDGSSRDVADDSAISLAARKDQRLRLSVTLGGVPASETRFADGLSYIYPNPFPERSGLVFTLARGGDLEANIYDVNGRFVRKLSAPGSGSGERVLVWDGRDRSGRMVSSGVYLTRYRVGGVVGVARLVKIE